MFTQIRNACAVLENGGLILYPTDTIWGIGCHALDPAAIGRVYNLKQRADTKSLIILLAEARQIFSYVAAPPPDIVNIIDSFQRPTTVIYEQALGLPDNLVNPDGSIAIRVSRDPFCKSLVKKLGAPLVSTSANLSGQPAPGNFSEISLAIRAGVDYIVDLRQEEPEMSRASRILRIRPDGSREIIRD